jgi:hypothetical protein
MMLRLNDAIRRGVDGRRLANLIIASPESSLLIARLERNDEALCDAKDHLHGYIEAEIRNHKRGIAFLI